MLNQFATRDRQHTVEDRLFALHRIANALELIAEPENADVCIIGPLRFLSRSLRAEVGALHHGLDAYLGDPCPLFTDDAAKA